jgi:hypothetical protein
MKFLMDNLSLMRDILAVIAKGKGGVKLLEKWLFLAC